MPAVTVDEAIGCIVAAAPITGARQLSLARAHDRVLATEVVALRDHPPFHASAMDGYAVTSDATTLRVIGESRAGAAFTGRVNAGEAVRVFTGAPVPDGTIAVILQENITRHDDVITVVATDTKPHLRTTGQDFAAGEAVLKAGDRLDALRLALAAASGAGHVHVRKKPRILCLGTGDELVPPGHKPTGDQVFESVSFALLALARTWGAKAKWLGVHADNAGDLARTIGGGEADLIVTVGGASVGDYDVVRPALRSLGFEAAFDKVDMKPGRPASFGRLKDGTHVLCLPGNPGTALVCAHLFLRTFISAALAETIDLSPRFLPSATDLPANGGRETFLRGRREAGGVATLADQDAALIKSFARADVLIRRRAEAPAVAAGHPVEVIYLRGG